MKFRSVFGRTPPILGCGGTRARNILEFRISTPCQSWARSGVHRIGNLPNGSTGPEECVIHYAPIPVAPRNLINWAGAGVADLWGSLEHNATRKKAPTKRLAEMFCYRFPCSESPKRALYKHGDFVGHFLLITLIQSDAYLCDSSGFSNYIQRLLLMIISCFQHWFTFGWVYLSFCVHIGFFRRDRKGI